jgi:hypothetical protein
LNGGTHFILLSLLCSLMLVRVRVGELHCPPLAGSRTAVRAVKCRRAWQIEELRRLLDSAKLEAELAKAAAWEDKVWEIVE